MNEYYPSKRALLTSAEQWLPKAAITPFKSPVKLMLLEVKSSSIWEVSSLF